MKRASLNTSCQIMPEVKGRSVCTALICLAAWAIVMAGRGGLAAELPVERGVVQFQPGPREAELAPRFQLPASEFSYESRLFSEAAPELTVSHVTFPSAVVTPHANNNTVHCVYYSPKGTQKRPAVIVLHILGGDFPLARVFCNAIALKGSSALFIKMPYYGPREQPGVPRRMISDDPAETVEGMTQAVLDVRRATAWLAQREEVDAQQLGIFGISLGGITGALAASVEPRLQNLCLVLAGGDLGKVAWDARELRRARERFEAKGGTREQFLEALQEIDPVRYASAARGRRILMLNAAEDEVVPRVCTIALWQALGEPEIFWYDGGHYSVLRHIVDAIRRVGDFFAPPV